MGFLSYYRTYIHRLSEKLREFYELLKIDNKITITEDLLDDYKAIKTALTEACGLALKQLIKERQYVIMADASFRTSGYALMIEAKGDKKTNLQKENICPSSIWLKSILPSPTQKYIYIAKNF